MTGRKSRSKTAAQWVVDLASAGHDPRNERDFTAWLGRDEHEGELERCEAALELAARLKDDPAIRPFFDELAALRPPRRHRIRDRLLGPRLRFGIAALATLAAIALFVWRDAARRDQDPQTREGSAAALVSGLVLEAGGAEPVVMLAGRVVVDVRSVAVLPFVLVSGDATVGNLVAQADAGIAAEFHREVIDALAAISGIYVVARESVLPYSALELLPREIAPQLGVRGIVEGSVRLDGERVRVAARLTDTATNTLLWQETYEGPMDALVAIEADVARSVAVALSRPVGRPTSVGPNDYAASPLIAAGR